MAQNLRPNNTEAEKFVLAYDHASATGDTTVKLLKADRKMRIDKVRYVNPTGLAEDATNFFDVQLIVRAAVAANWSTETGQEGTLTADTWVDLSLTATAADLILAADDELALTLDESGTATLPAGRIVVFGRWI